MFKQIQRFFKIKSKRKNVRSAVKFQDWLEAAEREGRIKFLSNEELSNIRSGVPVKNFH